MEDFGIDELIMIRDLVEEEIAARKERGDHDYFIASKKILEKTLEIANYKIIIK